MELNYRVFGAGDPVVIVHGLFGMLDNWQTFAKALSQHYMVYIVDQRDHGKSPHTEAFSYELLAQDLTEFCEQQWIHEARFIGHSMGGKTVLQMAAGHSSIIQQMVIVDMGIKQYDGGHEEIIAALQRVPVAEIASRGDAEAILAESITDSGVRQFLLKNLSREKSGGYRWKMNLDLLSQSYSAILSGINVPDIIDIPALFARGSKSAYVTDEDWSEIKACFTSSRLTTVEDAGHWIHAEQPSILLSEVVNFFSELS